MVFICLLLCFINLYYALDYIKNYSAYDPASKSYVSAMIVLFSVQTVLFLWLSNHFK